MARHTASRIKQRLHFFTPPWSRITQAGIKSSLAFGGRGDGVEAGASVVGAASGCVEAVVSTMQAVVSAVEEEASVAVVAIGVAWVASCVPSRGAHCGRRGGGTGRSLLSPKGLSPTQRKRSSSDSQLTLSRYTFML